MKPEEREKFCELFQLLTEAEWSVDNIAEGFGLTHREVIAILAESPAKIERVE